MDITSKEHILQEAHRIVAVTQHAVGTMAFDDSFLAVVEHLSTHTASIFFIGVGKSGIIAKKLSATFASLGFPAFYLHPIEALHGDMGRIRTGDTIIALSNSGTTIELLEALQAIQERAVTIVAITGGKDSLLSSLAHYTLLVTTKEACSWNVIPTTSLILAMLMGDALALCVTQYKQLVQADFARNHPKGALGALLHNTVLERMQIDNLPIVSHNATFKEALSVLHQHNYGAVFMLDETRHIVGVLTDGDVRRILLHNTFSFEDSIKQYMKTNPKVATIDMKTAQLLDIMEQNAITIVPIVDNNAILCGVLHIHDILGRGSIQFC